MKKDFFKTNFFCKTSNTLTQAPHAQTFRRTPHFAGQEPAPVRPRPINARPAPVWDAGQESCAYTVAAMASMPQTISVLMKLWSIWTLGNEYAVRALSGAAWFVRHEPRLTKVCPKSVSEKIGHNKSDTDLCPKNYLNKIGHKFGYQISLPWVLSHKFPIWCRPAFKYCQSIWCGIPAHV